MQSEFDVNLTSRLSFRSGIRKWDELSRAELLRNSWLQHSLRIHIRRKYESGLTAQSNFHYRSVVRWKPKILQYQSIQLLLKTSSTVWNVKTTPALFIATLTQKRLCTLCWTHKFTIHLQFLPIQLHLFLCSQSKQTESLVQYKQYMSKHGRWF